MISNVTLPTNYQQFIHKSRYARWMDENERREEWHETVHRYVNFMSAHLKNKFKPTEEQPHVNRMDLLRRSVSLITEMYNPGGSQYEGYSKRERNRLLQQNILCINTDQ